MSDAFLRQLDFFQLSNDLSGALDSVILPEWNGSILRVQRNQLIFTKLFKIAISIKHKYSELSRDKIVLLPYQQNIAVVISRFHTVAADPQSKISLAGKG